MLPLRGMVRTSSGTRFSERGSRTPGSALTFSQTHTRSSASYKGDGAFAVDEARGILRFADARPSLLRVPDRLVVFQLPVGVVADRTPRRRTIILSELFRSAGILGYGISATFWGYVAANVVWSLGAAFSIGTSAYLYETLLEAGHETEFPRYIGRVTMIQLLANAAGAFVGGVFVELVGDLRLTLLVGALLNLAAVGVAVTFREPKVERMPESTYVEQLVQGLRVVRRREGVALLIGVEVFLGVTLYVMAVFRPLYLQALGLSESAIAISISGFLLVAAIWSAFAGTITRVLGEFGTLALLVLIDR